MNIIYEDEYIYVINKPAGLPTETKAIGVRDLQTELLKYRKSKKEPSQVYIVHRLDQPVSGLMVVAKDSASAAALSKEDYSSFSKNYRALVYGNPAEDSIELTDYLKRDSKTNTSTVSNKEDQNAKKAALELTVIERGPDTTLVNVKLFTGRHHQIRVQLANHGIPIVGDTKYGSKESVEYSRLVNAKRVYLCATKIEFTHPLTHRKMHFETEADF